MRTVIVGASLAGLRAAEALRQSAQSGEIVMLGAEPHPPYQRPPLSKDWLLPAEPLPELPLQPAAFFEAQRISLRTSARAERLDVNRREVILARGERVPFDRLLISTGASPRRLDVPGAELDGVRTLRSVDDANRLRAALQVARNVVVVGAGLIGLEVASAARLSGAKVTVIERGATPLDRLLGGNAIGSAVSELVASSGVTLHLSRTVAFFEGRGAVRAVVLDDGTRIPAELVVVAAGIVPNTTWLEGSGVAQHDGVLVDPSLRTNVEGILAAGDVARVYLPRYATHVRFEQFGAASEQGTIAGRVLAGVDATFSAVPGGGTSAFGARLQLSGRVQHGDEVVVRGDRAARSFVAFFVSHGVVHAAFAMNRPKEFLAARKLVDRAAAVDLSVLHDEARPLAA